MSGNNSNNNNNTGGGGIFSFFSTKSSSSPEVQQERIEIYNNFASIVKSKFNDPENVRKLDTIYSNQTDYEVEKKKLTEMNNNGLTKGLAMGICTFAFLRFGPKVITNYMMKRRGGRGGGYKFDMPQSSGRSPFDATNAASGNQAAGGGGGREYKPSFFMRSLKFTLDVTVSIFISIYASAIFTDRKKLLKDASDIPLIQGKSLISDEMCRDFRVEYSRYSPEVWERQKNDLLMDSLRNFVVNCRKRDMYEEQIRRESGMMMGEDVLIPSPGVPEDLDVSFLEGESEQDILGQDGAAGSIDNKHMVADKNNDDDYFGSESDFEFNKQDEINAEDGEQWNSIKDFDDDDDNNSSEINNNGNQNEKPRRGWGW